MFDDASLRRTGTGPGASTDRQTLSDRLARGLGRSEALRYRFVLVPEGRVALPDPAGLALGVCFDEAVRLAVCPRRSPDCDYCPDEAHCSYPVLGRQGSRQTAPWVLRLEQPLTGLDRRALPVAAAWRRRLQAHGPALHLAPSTPADGHVLEPGQPFFVDLLLFGRAARRVQAVLGAVHSLSRVGLPGQQGGQRVPFRLESVHTLPFVGQGRCLGERGPSGRLTALQAPRAADSILPEWSAHPGLPSAAALERTICADLPLELELRTPLDLHESNELGRRRSGDRNAEQGEFATFVRLALERWEALAPNDVREYCDPHSTLRAQLVSAAQRVPLHRQLVERLLGGPGQANRLRGRFRFGPGARAFLPLLRFAERVGLGQHPELGRGEILVLDAASGL